MLKFHVYQKFICRKGQVEKDDYRDTRVFL